MVGIVGYGVYIPMWRIKLEEIAKIWGGEEVEGEKSVPGLDEDTATISVEASREALLRAEIDPQKIGAIFIGSESHPYVIKPTASIVAEAIGATPNLTAADLEFACKAGTAGIQAIMGMINSGMIEYGLAIGADTAQGKPGDDLEFTAGAGGAAYILGKENLIAEIEDTFSFTTDTPDFWRREKEEFPRHAGRFTGEPAYFAHVISSTKGLLEKLNRNVEDYDYFVFHQPNMKFPLKAASILGIPKEKIIPGLLNNRIGNTYSGSSLLGLAAVLDIAKPGDKIFVTSYGSGAGSDSFSIIVKDLIEDKRNKAKLVEDYIKNKKYVNYAEYVKFRRKIKGY